MRHGLFLLLLLIGYVSHAQYYIDKLPVIRTLRNIRNALVDIAISSPEISSAKAKSKDIINNAIINIDSRTDSFPAAYNQALERLLLFVKSIPRDDSVAAKNMLLLLLRDVQLKFGKKPQQLSSAAYSYLLDVTVVTLRNKSPAPDLRIRYAPLGYKIDYEHPEGSFQNLSTPVTQKMVPGYYVIWVTNDGEFRKLVGMTVEIDPEQKNQINFNIPSDGR